MHESTKEVAKVVSELREIHQVYLVAFNCWMNGKLSPGLAVRILRVTSRKHTYVILIPLNPSFI